MYITVNIERYNTSCVADDFSTAPYEDREVIALADQQGYELTYERYVAPSFFARIFGCLSCMAQTKSTRSSGLLYYDFLRKEYSKDERTLFMLWKMVPPLPVKASLFVRDILRVQQAIARWKEIESILTHYTIKAAIVHHYKGYEVGCVRESGNDSSSSTLIAAFLQLKICNFQNHLVSKEELKAALEYAEEHAHHKGGLLAALAKECRRREWTIPPFPLFYDNKGILLENPLGLKDEELFVYIKHLVAPPKKDLRALQQGVSK